MANRKHCSVVGCTEDPEPRQAWCIGHQLDGSAPEIHQLDHVVLIQRTERPRSDPYEATCLMCGLEWWGRLTEWQALLVRLCGARCGNCRGFVEVIPTLMGSPGCVLPTTVVKAMAMHRRGMVGAA